MIQRRRVARTVWVIVFSAAAAYFEFLYTSRPEAGAVIFFALLAISEAIDL